MNRISAEVGSNWHDVKQLRVISLYLLLVTVVATPLLMALWALYHNVGFVIMIVECVVYGLGLTWARTRVNVSNANRASVLLSSGLWAIALSTGFLFPPAVPVAIILNVLSVVIVLNTADRATLFWLSIGASVASGPLVASSFLDPVFPLDVPLPVMAGVTAAFAIVDSGLVFVVLVRQWGQRRRAEEELRRLTAVLDQTTDFVGIANVNRRVLYANPAARRALGLSAEQEISEMSIDDAHPPWTNEILIREALPTAIQEGVWRGEGAWLGADGREIPLSMVILSHRGSKGEVEFLSTISRDLTERIHAERALLDQAKADARAEELERSRTRVLEVSESIRKEIGRHLHSTVQNKLILLLYRLTELIDNESIKEIRSEVKGVRISLDQIIENDVRRIGARIYPGILKRGIVAGLRSLGDVFETQLTVHLKLDRQLEEKERNHSRYLSEKVRTSVYRIAEESLTNTLKHAEAETVEVRLVRPSEETLRIEISDDGVGFEVGPIHSGLGLGLINDYAEVAGGTAEIRSQPGKETVVTAATGQLRREVIGYDRSASRRQVTSCSCLHYRPHPYPVILFPTRSLGRSELTRMSSGVTMRFHGGSERWEQPPVRVQFQWKQTRLTALCTTKVSSGLHSRQGSYCWCPCWRCGLPMKWPGLYWISLRRAPWCSAPVSCLCWRRGQCPSIELSQALRSR